MTDAATDSGDASVVRALRRGDESLEARVTDAVRNLPSVVLCAYDVRRLSGRQLLQGGLECHPLTLRHTSLRHNEHHVPTQPFLERLSADA